MLIFVSQPHLFSPLSVVSGNFSLVRPRLLDRLQLLKNLLLLGHAESSNHIHLVGGHAKFGRQLGNAPLVWVLVSQRDDFLNDVWSQGVIFLGPPYERHVLEFFWRVGLELFAHIFQSRIVGW